MIDYPREPEFRWQKSVLKGLRKLPRPILLDYLKVYLSQFLLKRY
jgi:hypothetical protein